MDIDSLYALLSSAKKKLPREQLADSRLLPARDVIAMARLWASFKPMNIPHVLITWRYARTKLAVFRIQPRQLHLHQSTAPLTPGQDGLVRGGNGRAERGSAVGQTAGWMKSGKPTAFSDSIQILSHLTCHGRTSHCGRYRKCVKDGQKKG